MFRRRLPVAFLAIIGCMCCGATVFAGAAGAWSTNHAVAPESPVANEKVFAPASDEGVPRGVPVCAPCPAGSTCVSLCQNVNDVADPNPAPPEVPDCTTSTRRNTYCFAIDSGPDPDSNVFVEYARAWDLSTEPGVAGHSFEVRCVGFFVWQLDINPALMSSVAVTVTIYQDTDGGDPVTAEGGTADLLFLGQKVVNIPTTPSIIPSCGLNGSCASGVPFTADFSGCPVSLPANSNLVVAVAIQDVAAVTGAGQGGIHIGCTARSTPRPSYYRYPGCGVANFLPAAAPNPPVTRQTVIYVEGRLDQPPNLGSCCHRETGVCELTAPTVCNGQFDVYTPCGPCIQNPDNCPIATGSCCNDTTGTCSDGVNIAGCQAPEERFTEGATCAALDPPCTNSLNNDQCSEAVNIASLPATILDNTRFSSFQDTPDCDPEAAGDPDDEVGGVYYTVTGTGGQITISCCPPDGGYADYDQKITVYCGSNCNDLVCVNNPTDGDDACGTGGGPSKVVFCSRPAPQKYWILFHGFPNANTNPEGQGHFKAIITSTGPCGPAPFCVPTGACCINSCGGCSIVPASGTGGCASLGGTYLGDGTDCTSCGTPTTGCCTGDTDANGTLNGRDIAGFTSGLISPPACDTQAFCRLDVNGDGFANVSDVSPFVNKLLNGPACNDVCGFPQSLGATSTTLVDNNSATESADDPNFSCYFSGTPNPAENTLWYSFVATNASIRINTCAAPGTADPATDTLLALYDGSCGALTQLACAEDDCGATGFLSNLCYDGLTVGNTYLVEVASFGNADAGQMLLQLASPASPACPAPPPPPITNDSCAAPGVLVNGINTTDTSLATTDGAPFTAATPACFTGFNNTIENDVWATYTATCTGTLTLDLCDENPGPGQTSYDSRIAVYTVAPCPPGEANSLGCNDDCGPSFSSLLQVPVTSGQTYLVRVGGFGPTDRGTATIDVSCSP